MNSRIPWIVLDFTTYQKYLSVPKGGLYVALIDFKTVFDFVSRQQLKNKLEIAAGTY